MIGDGASRQFKQVWTSHGYIRSASDEFDLMVSAVSQAPAAGTSRKSVPHGPLVLHLMGRLDHRPEARMVSDLAVLTQRRGWRAALASMGGPLVIEAERAAVRHVQLPSHPMAPRHGWLGGWQCSSSTITVLQVTVLQITVLQVT
ncbi:MAG: hypothetical protein EBV03_13585, partial [Proteobacteria bacterium]|nr:hypothetical protein [Pseudomonadota bacterium]